MEIKKSKPSSIEAKGTFDSKFGLMYKYEISMEDGNTGQYASKKYTSTEADGFPFIINVETEYEWHPGQYPAIKPKSDFKASKGGNGSNASFALSYAKDVLVASYMTANPEILTLSTEQMFDLANKMNEWLNKN